jgi:hypothetical protein
LERFLFHSFDAERISEALRRTIRHSTAATLTSATPIVVIALTADVVKADVVIKVDKIIFYLSYQGKLSRTNVTPQ